MLYEPKEGWSKHLTLCMLCFYCHLLTFSKLTASKNSFRNTIRVSNDLDPDQYRLSVGPDFGQAYQQIIKFKVAS